MNVNPDTMNFLYVYAGYQYHQIQILILMDSGCFFMSQIVLPEEIKFIIITITLFQGNYFLLHSG
jgi:hypothetical protein